MTDSGGKMSQVILRNALNPNLPTTIETYLDIEQEDANGIITKGKTGEPTPTTLEDLARSYSTPLSSNTESATDSSISQDSRQQCLANFFEECSREESPNSNTEFSKAHTDLGSYEITPPPEHEKVVKSKNPESLSPKNATLFKPGSKKLN